MTTATPRTIPHTRVEYDPTFYGGDYHGTGTHALIPHAIIDNLNGDVEEAFRCETGLDPCHIVHYTQDEVYDRHGNLIEDYEGSGNGDEDDAVDTGEGTDA